MLVASVALAACGGIVLPCVSLLLDRWGLFHEPAGGWVRRVGIGMAAALAAFAALTIDEAGGWGRVAGATLLLFALAVILIGATRRPGSGSDADSPGFGSTLLGVVVFGLGFFFLVFAFSALEGGFLAAMRHDLRALASAQEANFDSAGVYSADPSVGGRVPASGDVAIRVWLTPDGWGGESTHPAIRGRCAVYAGSTGAPPAARPDEVACVDESTSRARAMGALATTLVASAALLLAAGVVTARRHR